MFASVRSEVPGPRSRLLRDAEALHLAPGTQRISQLAGIAIEGGEGALLRVQQIAVRTGDQPMTEACGAFAALLANPGAIDDTFRASLKGCMDRLAQLVAALLEQAALKRAARAAA